MESYLLLRRASGSPNQHGGVIQQRSILVSRVRYSIGEIDVNPTFDCRADVCSNSKDAWPVLHDAKTSCYNPAFCEHYYAW